MSNTFNFYCDESCHLLNDRQEVMTLGTVWCLAEKRREICVRLREIKARHNLSPQFEVKWGKISPAKAEFYLDWLDLFLDDDDLRFRAVVVPQKSKPHHGHDIQTHDDLYYKVSWVVQNAEIGETVRVFRQSPRKNEKPWVLWLHEFEYAVILWERKEYLLLKTAFVVKPHKQKEFERDWKSHQAPNG